MKPTTADLIALLERANCAFPAQISVSNHLDYCVFCRDKKALLTALRSGEVVLCPREPTEGLLMSMALRSDHALGYPGYYDRLIIKAVNNNISHDDMLRVAITSMRQIHKEVVGTGFYRPERDEEYRAMLACARKEKP